MKILLLMVVLMISSRLIAEDNCGHKNFITMPNSPFEQIPVYDQDGNNMCYAYAASVLIDFHLIRKGSKERKIHPAWAGLAQTVNAKRDNLDYGLSYWAIKGLQDMQNCRYENVATAIHSWAKKANATEAEVLSLIEKLGPEMMKLGSKGSKLSNSDVKNVLDTVTKSHQEGCINCSGRVTWDNLLPELEAMKVMSSQKMLSSLLFPVCAHDKEKLSLPPPRWVDFYEDDSIAPFVKIKLEATVPISVSYCAHLLVNQDYDGIVDNNKRNDVSPDCFVHESVIVGKKRMGGMCHYLLRNSWGNGWNISNRNFKCLCRNRVTGSFMDNCYESRFNTGEWSVEACWVKESDLTRNIKSATTVE